MPRHTNATRPPLVPNGTTSTRRTSTRSSPKPPSNNYLAPLRATTLRSSTPAKLPLELIAQILDYLPPPTLIACARTSHRLQEMVYEDARWVQKLRMMGVWKEAEARQRFEQSMRQKTESLGNGEGQLGKRRIGVDLPGHGDGDLLGGRLKESTLFDAFEDGQQQRSRGINGAAQGRVGGQHYSLEAESLRTSDTSGGNLGDSRPRSESLAALDILKNVKSIRGHAREEFGKIYGALAPLYLDVARTHKNHTSARVFKTYNDPEYQARALNNLRIFSRCDVSQGWEGRETQLESTVAIFENAALREFEGGYIAREYDGRMRKYARVLATLNGGMAAVDMFIYKNPVMQQKQKFGRPLANLEEPTAAAVNMKPSQGFFHALSRSLDEQVAIIDRIFPHDVDVMLPFLDRIAEDIVAEYINPLFDEAHRTGSDTYTQVVAGLFEQALRFEASLYPAEGSKQDFHSRVTKIMFRCFEPHVELYLQEELVNLDKTTKFQVDSWERRLAAEEESTESFFMSNVNRQAAKRDFMTSFRKVIMMPVNVLPGMSSSSAKAATNTNPDSGRATPLTNPGDRSSTPIPTQPKEKEAPTTELAAKAAIMNSRLEGIATLFSIEVALNLVHAAKSSLSRASSFVQLGGRQGDLARETCQKIFVHLLQILGHRHIKSGFDKAVSHLSSYKPRSNITTTHDAHNEATNEVRPLSTFLELVNVGDLIQQMLDVFFAQQLVAKRLVDRDDFLDPAVKEKKRFEQMLDERVAAGLNRGIDVLIGEVEYLCSTTQSPSDFRPGTWTESGRPASQASSTTAPGTTNGVNGTSEVFDIGPTKTARLIVELVSSHTSMLTGTTDKNMLDVFNTEVGLRLFTALCKHLKRQRVSTSGAIPLISDTNLYYEYVASLKNRELARYFKALRELAQVFLVDGRHAKELAGLVSDTERWAGVWGTEEVLEFAERRADWFVIRGEVERALYGMGCCVM